MEAPREVLVDSYVDDGMYESAETILTKLENAPFQNPQGWRPARFPVKSVVWWAGTLVGMVAALLLTSGVATAIAAAVDPQLFSSGDANRPRPNPTRMPHFAPTHSPLPTIRTSHPTYFGKKGHPTLAPGTHAPHGGKKSKRPSYTPTRSPHRYGMPTASPSMVPTISPNEEAGDRLGGSTANPSSPAPGPDVTGMPSAHPTISSGSTTSAPTMMPSLSTLTPTSSPERSLDDPPESTSSPTEAPSQGPTMSSDSPTESPSIFPTMSSTDTPSLSPTKMPVIESASPTDSPLIQPTISTASPTDSPSAQPSESTGSPTSAPSMQPIATTNVPSSAPSMQPTSTTTSPSAAPSLRPSSSTGLPTSAPAVQPTVTTEAPTYSPSNQPTMSTDNPTSSPSSEPTKLTDSPTSPPSSEPTMSTDSPTTEPTMSTGTPTAAPSQDPTMSTASPTDSPTFQPTMPTDSPTDSPSVQPTMSTDAPTDVPTAQPTMSTDAPTEMPMSTSSSAPTPLPTQLRTNDYIRVFLTSPSTTPTAAVNAFNNAATLWSSILRGTRINTATVGPGVTFNNPFSCGLTFDTAIPQGSINQLYIAAEIRPIDGVGGTLGSAGYCGAFLTNSDNGLLMPVIGRMFFDTADMENMASNGQLENVILHEMAHVLGFGTLWTTRAVVEDEIFGTVTNPFNSPRYVGHAGKEEYAALGGSGDIPVEDGSFFGLTPAQIASGIGRGSIDSHWMENLFDNELMTPALNFGRENPLSVMSLRSFEDLGYAIDPDYADAYSLPASTTVSHDGESSGESYRVDLTNDVFMLDAEKYAEAYDEALKREAARQNGVVEPIVPK